MRNNLINRWVILGALGIGILLLVISLQYGLGRKTNNANAPDLKVAEITLIAGPTSTPRIAPSPTNASAQGTATPRPGEIAVNTYVQIVGTQSEGLRLRENAGLQGKPLFLGFDTEIFQVGDGPIEADGYIWWYLISPYDDTRAGWAAANFLETIEAPQE